MFPPVEKAKLVSKIVDAISKAYEWVDYSFNPYDDRFSYNSPSDGSFTDLGIQREHGIQRDSEVGFKFKTTFKTHFQEHFMNDHPTFRKDLSKLSEIQESASESAIVDVIVSTAFDRYISHWDLDAWKKELGNKIEGLETLED